MIKQYLQVGQDVTYIGPDKHEVKAKILTVYSDSFARIEWANGSAVAEHSESGKENTFRFEQASSEAKKK